MANQPKNMNDEQWQAHRAEAKREHDERALVDADHTAAILELQRRVGQLEHVVEHAVASPAAAAAAVDEKPAKKPAAKKARR